MQERTNTEGAGHGFYKTCLLDVSGKVMYVVILMECSKSESNSLLHNHKMGNYFGTQ